MLGITNFDLLGNFGRIRWVGQFVHQSGLFCSLLISCLFGFRWLGNYFIIFGVNIVFGGAASVCLFNKVLFSIIKVLNPPIKMSSKKLFLAGSKYPIKRQLIHPRSLIEPKLKFGADSLISSSPWDNRWKTLPMINLPIKFHYPTRWWTNWAQWPNLWDCEFHLRLPKA